MVLLWAIVRLAKRRNKKKPTAIPYLEDFYNVQGFYPKIADVKMNALSRIYNHVVEALNEDLLPRFLIIVIDKDIFQDISIIDFGVAQNISAILNWLTRQVDIVVRWKKFQLVNTKPGAIISDAYPTVIYVDMMKQIGIPKNSRILTICDLCFKFNSLLHEAVDRQGAHVLSIRSCHLPDHFDTAGNLTNAGKIEFWHEMDELLKMYDSGKIKLLPRLHLLQKQKRPDWQGASHDTL